MKQIREDIQTGKNVRKRIKGGFTEDKHTCVATEKNAGDHADNKCELHTVETGPVKGKRGVCNQRVETKEPRHRGPDEDNVRNNANIGDDGCEDKYKTWETHSAPDNVDCKVAAGDSVVTEEEVTGDIKARAAPMVTDDTPRHKQTAQRQDTMDARAEEETEKGNEHTQPEHMYTINKQETDGGNTGAAHMTQIFKEMQQQWQNAGLQVEVGVDVLAMPGFSRVFESNDGNKDRGVSAADKPRKNHFLRTAPPVSEHNTASCSASSACKSRCVRQGEVDPNEEVKIEQEWEKQGRSRREYCLLETRESQSTREHEQCWQQDQSEDDYVSKSSTDGGNEKNKDADVREEFIDETGRRDFARPLDAFETFFDLATCSSRSSGHQGEIQKQGRCCGTVQRARERGRQLSNRFHTRFEKSLHPVRCRVHPWQAHPLSVAEKVLYMRKGMTPSRFLSTRWAWPRSSIPCPIFGSVPDPLLASSSACFRMPLSSADNRHSHVPGSLAMESPLVLAIRHIEVPSAQSASGHAEPSFALDDLEHRMGLLSYTVDAGTVAATSYCGWVADDPSRLSGFLTLQERGGPPTARTLASSSCTSVPLQLNNCCSLAINSSFLEKTLSPSLLGNHTVASSTMSKLFNSRHPLSPPPEYESTQEVLEVDPKGTRREVAETGNTSEKQQRQDRDKIQSSASNVLEHDKGRSPRLNIVTEKMTMRTLSDCTFSCLSLSPSASCCLSGSEPTHFQSDGKWKESASAVTELPRRQRRDSFVEKRKDMREQGVQTEISAECHGVKKTNVGYSDEGRGQSPLSTRARVLLKRWRRNSLRKQRHFLALLVGSGRTLASSSRNGTHTYAAQSAHIISTEVCNQALARVEAGIGKRGENKRNKGATKKEAQEQSAAGCQTTMSAPKAQASASIIIRLASQSMPTDAENTSFTLQGGSVGMGLGGRERGNRGLCSNPQMRGTAGRKDVSPAGFPSQHVPKNVESDREEDFEQGWATIGFGEAFWESSSRAMDPGPASQVGNAKTSGGSVPLPHFSALSIKCSPPASQRPCSAYASILSSLVVRADVEEDNNIYTKEDHESEIPTKNNDENKTNDATSKPGTGRARGRPRKGQAQANYTGNSGCRTQPEFGGSTGVFRPIPATKTDMTVEAEGQLENTKKKCTAERRRTKRSARAREIEAARGLAGDEKRATKEEHGETRSLKARVRKVSSSPAITSHNNVSNNIYNSPSLSSPSNSLAPSYRIVSCLLAAHPKELLVLPKNLVRPLAFLGFLDENQTERPKEEGTPMMMNATPSASPSNRLPYNIPPGEEDVSYSRSTSSGERTAASSSDSLTGLLELWLEEGDKIARENAPPKQPTVSPASSSIRSPATTYGSHTRNRQEPRELFCPAKQEEQNWLKTWHQKEGMQHWEGEKLFTDPGFAVQGKNAEAEGRDQEEAEKSRGDATVGSEACGPAVVAVAVVNVGSIVSVTHKNQRGHEVMERHMPQEEEAQMVESVFSPSYCSTPSRGPSVSMAHATEMETANDMSIRARQPSIFPQPREDDVYSPPPGAEEPTTSFAPSSSPTRQREWQGKFSNRTSRRCALDGGETDTRIPPRSSRFPSSANAIHAAADRELQLKQSLSKVAEEATKLAAQFERMDRLCFALEGLETDREERRFRMSSLEKAALRPQVRKVQCSAQFQSRQKSFSSEEMSSEDEISWQWKVERRRGRFFRTKGKVFFSCFHPAQWREYILNKMDVGRDSHWDLNADNWSSPKSFSQPNFRQRAKDFLYCHLCL
uniref:Uncharacterized protein n=1 Tax=Toxoplasma gondii (strain ATCC 50861 / VEG) TaxID=432359 RepID=A0A0F7V6B3_TOXGV|nr:TPA: hypothetical protein BN1205_086340 [Toxoplasma gondii VEG]